MFVFFYSYEESLDNVKLGLIIKILQNYAENNGNIEKEYRSSDV